MIFSLNDSFLALLVRMCNFARIHLYVSAQTSGAGPFAAQALVRPDAHHGEYHGEPWRDVFWRRFCPFLLLVFQVTVYPEVRLNARRLCVCDLGGTYLANLIFPEDHTLFQYICFPPMAIADIATGFYLMLFAIKSEHVLA